MDGVPWGGSEELWTRTATLLAEQQVPVAASVHGWHRLDQRTIELSRVGIDLRPRPTSPSILTSARRYLSGKPIIAIDIDRAFGTSSPRLVVISNGATFPPIDLAEMCVAKGWPFATVAHTNVGSYWPPDVLAARFRKVLPLARRCFFVSKANQILAEKQLGYDFENAEIVYNPLLVEVASSLPWPVSEEKLCMASVGRLSPEKGQDVLLEVLAQPHWRNRSLQLTLYGDGPCRDQLGRLVAKFRLQDRVSFAGHVAVDQIWRKNHVLVMPSRHEGMPLTVVEAMWCGRPVVATNVGGNSEVIEDGTTGFLAEAAVPECFAAALEAMWAQRVRLQEIGQAAATRIRAYLPNDPVGSFARKLMELSI